MKTSIDIISGIISIIDPLCRDRYMDGGALPQGFDNADNANRMQDFRERAATAKALRIMALIEEKL